MWHLMLEKHAAYVGASKVVRTFAERFVFFWAFGFLRVQVNMDGP